MANRWWLLLALLPAIAVAQDTGRGLSNYPTAPAAEPFRETVFGVEVDDPYRWMERVDRTAELTAWINAASRHTTAELAALPGRAALLAQMRDAASASDRYLDAVVAGERVFVQKLRADGNVPGLYVRERGVERLLFDPAAGRNGAAPRTINSYSVSPGGGLVAINIAEGGSEIGTVHFFDVASGRETAEALSPVWGESSPEWLDDGTVLYLRMRDARPGEDPLKGETVRLHRLGTAPATDLPLLGTDVRTGFAITEEQVPYAQSGPGSTYVVAVAGGAQSSVPMAVGTVAAMRAGKPDWRMLATVDDGVMRESQALIGDTLYYVSTRNDPQGEIRALDLKPGATLARSRRVLGGIGVISRALYTRDGVYAFVANPHAAARLWYQPHGWRPRQVPLPFVGSAFLYRTSADGGTASFSFDGFQQSTSSYRLDNGRLAPLGLESATYAPARRFTVLEEEARSADGTQVPLTIVYAGARGRPRPTIIEAYGSYGISTEPQYSPTFSVWSARGGVYAICHTRGGGERGEAWHLAGARANKPNAHADLIACGRRLVALGFATPRTLGLFGSSAAGLLIPMAAMKAPDLFAAAVTRVGIVNPTRLAAAVNGANQFEEMGDPRNVEGFRALALQDSTLFLPRAAGGPDFLFAIGLNDRRVAPWMSAKLAAMMQARWGDRHLALIRADGDAGHGIGSTRDQSLAERADIFSFFLNRFGQPGFVR